MESNLNELMDGVMEYGVFSEEMNSLIGYGMGLGVEDIQDFIDYYDQWGPDIHEFHRLFELCMKKVRGN